MVTQANVVSAISSLCKDSLLVEGNTVWITAGFNSISVGID